MAPPVTLPPPSPAATVIQVRSNAPSPDPNANDTDAKSFFGLFKKGDKPQRFKDAQGNEVAPEIVNDMMRFRTRKYEKTIDVWWLFDDGGRLCLEGRVLDCKMTRVQECLTNG